MEESEASEWAQEMDEHINELFDNYKEEGKLELK